VEGARVYDGDAALALQRSLGRHESFPNLVWYAPHSLPLFCLFGALPYPVAWPVWLALQMILVFSCADRLWIHAGGPPEKRHHAALFTCAFYPTLALAVWRQASAIVLAGLVTFLLAQRRRRDLLAGAGLALVALKPQLLYLAWLGILAWIGRTRRVGVLAGFGVTVATGMGLAFLLNPAFTIDYLHHLIHRPPDFLVGPSLGSQLRVLFGARHYGLQFLPAALGLVWFGATWRRRAGQSLEDQLPALLAMSFVLSVFHWLPDLVVLLTWMIPTLATLVAGADRRARYAFLIPVLALSLATLVLHEWLYDQHFYVLSVLYGLLLFQQERRRVPARP